MTITARPYRDYVDLQVIRQFLMQAKAAVPERIYLHVGDVVWRVWDTLLEYEPSQVVQMWEDERGALQAFALFYPVYAGFNVQVHPQHRGSAVEEQLFAEAQAYLQTLMEAEGRSGAIDAWDVFEDDTTRIALLERLGYVRRSDLWYAAIRLLNEPIPEVSLPDGFTIRALTTSATDVAERIAHRDDITVARYHAFMQTPGYDHDLDLVAVAPDANFGAYCICWVDPMNGEGEFEPVGTRPAYRQHGLARALLQEGLRRMKARGMHHAVVCYEGDNTAARALYEAAGFHVDVQIYTYTKQLYA